ncbi:hypothetical protein BRADI_2g61712v3 [Brachypodium distachyon]|uniref:Uncharacterized protein n=1 Tax=Brachypodium distachyon TaxID=15368 RepID=A0A0Q3GML1_BRADI|nr:hypothetical protein BRADI_2g61712v3 [Brachypodium distachyon]
MFFERVQKRTCGSNSLKIPQHHLKPRSRTTQPIPPRLRVPQVLPPPLPANPGSHGQSDVRAGKSYGHNVSDTNFLSLFVDSFYPDTLLRL